MIVRFGVLCDLCGSGSIFYAVDCSMCDDCDHDLCLACERATGHCQVRDWDVDQSRLLSCAEGS